MQHIQQKHNFVHWTDDGEHHEVLKAFRVTLPLHSFGAGIEY